ncbi:MAG TPA: UbiA-like polyprenyltransferase [Pirellulales bacterium]|jgi:4-hydroxybenzoate polyprenyltransferase|nr:UbiA-like polyprenyltransferase [Pirellulales bacterium]
MFQRVRDLLEMIRFSHTLFALPFALLAAVMAWTAGARGEPPVAWRPQELLGIVLCMVTARSAAMAFNRIADRRLDEHNPRTRLRHLPAGTLSVASVAWLAVFSSLAFIAATLLFLPNRLPIYLSLPVLLFLLAYSFTKRFTAAAHFWLGAALMLSPVSAWIAIRGPQVEAHPDDLLPALLLGAAVLLWVAGFDIIYACQDYDFDRAAGLHSVPVRLGVRGALLLAGACHLGMVLLLAILPLFYPWGWIYDLGIAAVALLLAYEHWLVRPDDLSRVNVAFFQVNAVVSIGLFVVGSLDLLASAQLIR